MPSGLANLSLIKAIYDYWTAWVQIQALSGISWPIIMKLQIDNS
jgi:outer membrane protein TolC